MVVVAACRIGFVGAGGVAARHARTLALLPQARLIAVTDTDTDTDTDTERAARAPLALFGCR